MNNLFCFIRKVFTLRNFTKILVIFFVGLTSRILINHYFSVNVFTDYFHFVSISYYSFMSFFVVFVNEFVEFFIPSLDFLLKHFKFDYLKPSFWSHFFTKPLFFHQPFLLNNFKISNYSYKPNFINSFSKNSDTEGINLTDIFYKVSKANNQVITTSNTDLNILDKFKRKSCWVLVEKFNNNFNSYEEFKDTWDSNYKLFKSLRTNIDNKFNNGYHKLKVQKDTLNWFLGRRNPRN